jgi:hypothetical protein
LLAQVGLQILCICLRSRVTLKQKKFCLRCNHHCYLSWRVTVFFLLWCTRYFPSRDEGNYVGGVATDSLWPGMGYLENLEYTLGENEEKLLSLPAVQHRVNRTRLRFWKSARFYQEFRR